MLVDQNQGFPQNLLMKSRLPSIALAAFFTPFVFGNWLSAEENKELEGQKAAPSIQQQMEVLKEGQQRMLRRLRVGLIR